MRIPRLHSGGYWRILFDQILSLEFSPKLSRDLGLHGGVIRKNLLLAASAYNECRGDVRRRGELKRRSPQIDSVVACNLAKSFALFKKRRRNLVRLFSVVVTWTARDKPSVER